MRLRIYIENKWFGRARLLNFVVRYARRRVRRGGIQNSHVRYDSSGLDDYLAAKRAEGQKGDPF